MYDELLRILRSRVVMTKFLTVGKYSVMVKMQTMIDVLPIDD